MANKKLNTEAIKSLILSYQNQQAQLEFQLNRNASTLVELERDLANQSKDSAKPSASAPKRRGRPQKAKAVATGKRRGRPAKIKTDESSAEDGNDSGSDASASDAPKKRGRKPGSGRKAASATKTSPGRKAAPGRKAKPGRKPSTRSSLSKSKKAETSPADNTAVSAAPKRRGRPAKAMNASGVSGSVAVKPIKSKTRKAKPVKVTRSKTGRPAGTRATKNAAKSTAKKAAGASKANISRVNKDDAGGYRLSDWDNVLLQALQKAGKPIKKNDIDGVFKSNPIVTREKLNDDMLYSKVSRVIHKLANKRGLIRKEDSEGKGFAYALTTWYDDKTGKLKPEHGS